MCLTNSLRPTNMDFTQHIFQQERERERDIERERERKERCVFCSLNLYHLLQLSPCFLSLSLSLFSYFSHSYFLFPVASSLASKDFAQTVGVKGILSLEGWTFLSKNELKPGHCLNEDSLYKISPTDILWIFSSFYDFPFLCLIAFLLFFISYSFSFLKTMT